MGQSDPYRASVMPSLCSSHRREVKVVKLLFVHATVLEKGSNGERQKNPTHENFGQRLKIKKTVVWWPTTFKN